MADQTIFDYTLSLDVAADVSVDFSASQGYTSSGNQPWQVRLVIDGADNSSRGGSGALSDVISLIGAAGNMSAGDHNIKIIWYGSNAITLRGAVLRVLCTKK